MRSEKRRRQKSETAPCSLHIANCSLLCYTLPMANTIPTRDEVPASDKWDLSTLYTSDEEWEKALSSINMLTEKVVAFKGKLADSSDSLLGCLKANEALEKVIETVYNYASLQHTDDESDSAAQDREGRAMMVYAATTRMKAFINKVITVVAKWTRGGRRDILTIFTDNELAYAGLYADYG